MKLNLSGNISDRFVFVGMVDKIISENINCDIDDLKEYIFNELDAMIEQEIIDEDDISFARELIEDEIKRSEVRKMQIYPHRA